MGRGGMRPQENQPSVRSHFCYFARLVNRGGDEDGKDQPAPVPQRLLRHVDIKTTPTYYTNVDDVLEEAALKA